MKIRLFMTIIFILLNSCKSTQVIESSTPLYALNVDIFYLYAFTNFGFAESLNSSKEKEVWIRNNVAVALYSYYMNTRYRDIGPKVENDYLIITVYSVIVSNNPEYDKIFNDPLQITENPDSTMSLAGFVFYDVKSYEESVKEFKEFLNTPVPRDVIRKNKFFLEDEYIIKYHNRESVYLTSEKITE